MTRHPDELGDYRIERELGSGGMATVHLAQRRGPQGFRKQVALKVIRGELARQAPFRSMFVDEAKIAQSLHHGNVVQLYELGEAKGVYYIAMEYVCGANLLQLLKAQPRRRLPAALALYITRCLCRALQYAHDRRDERGASLGIVHRDVSPQNVLLAQDGQVKLADFGIARAVDRLCGSLPGTIKGKVGFLSPEQARGCADVDHRSDIFSLGLVTYLMLSGTNPLAAADVETSLRLTLDADIPPLCETSPALDDRLSPIVMRALARDPAQRYPSASAWLENLEALRFAQGDTTDSPQLADLLAASGVIEPPAPRRSLDGALERALGGSAEDDTDVSADTVAATPGGMAGSASSHGSVPRAASTAAAAAGRSGRARRWSLLLAGSAAALLAAVVWLSWPSTPTAEDDRLPPDLGSIEPRAPAATPPPPLRDAQSAADAPALDREHAAVSRPRGPRVRGERPAQQTGRLWINLLPWARVTVDGRPVGDTPQRLTLPAGPHRVQLDNPAVNLRRDLTVVIEPNQTLRIEKW